MKTLGNKIKEARLQKGLTQKQLASQLSIKNTTLNNWEQGRNKPDINYIEMLCNLLDVTPDYFIEVHRGKKTVTAEENELVVKYRALSREGKKFVQIMIENIKKYEKAVRGSMAQSHGSPLNTFPTSYIITPIPLEERDGINGCEINDSNKPEDKNMDVSINDDLEIGGSIDPSIHFKE